MKGVLTGIIVAGVAVGAARADVTLVRHTESNGFRGMGAHKTEETLAVSAQKARREQDVTYTGKLARTFLKPSHTVTLTRLDKDLIQTLNVKNKTYEELSFAEFRAQREKAKEALQGPQGGPSRESAPQKQTHKVTKSRFEVKPTGQGKTINGFPCKEYVMEMLLEVQNLETGVKSETRMVNTLWMTPETEETRAVQKEERDFALAQMKKMGFDVSAREMEAFGAALAAQMTGAGEKDLSGSLSKAAKELEKIKGYPIWTKTEWTMKSDEPKAGRPPAGETEEDGSVDVSGGVKGALGGLASKWAAKKVQKKMEEKAEAREKEPALLVITEVKSLSVAGVPASEFTVPSGYKKIERKTASSQ